MRKIKLHTACIEVGGEIREIPFEELLESCIEHVGPGGISLTQQRSRMKLLDALGNPRENPETKAVSFYLEDAEAAILVTLVETMPWSIVSPGIVFFSDSVLADCKREIEFTDQIPE